MKQIELSKHLFGTDGIRGEANVFPMTADMVMKVAMSAALEFQNGHYRHTVIIGKDTRLSGYLFEQALTAGFISMGFDVLLLGPLPTPAVSMLTQSMRADLGVMISASHNPFHDNGIKIFGPNGFKLSDKAEEKIAKKITENFEPYFAKNDQIGRVTRIDDAKGRYIEFVKSVMPDKISLDGLKIVIDCANGAAYQVAPRVLWELGAEIIKIAVDPDGKNINHECGATNAKLLQEKVIEHRADIGIALDGDADRLIIVDELGDLIDGDQIIAVIATMMKKLGRLSSDKVVTTVMSNLGLEKYLGTIGLQLLRANVGDRHVIEKMLKSKSNVGGEASGHIIFGDNATTGDGLKAALEVLSVMQSEKKKASEVCKLFEMVPQKMINIDFHPSLRHKNLLANAVLKKKLAEATESIGTKGRLLVRQSGTEPLIRVMLESEDAAFVASFLGALVEDLKKTISTL